MLDERSKAGETILARKTHRKSRLGCQECKRRRVKCDEKLPACSNCIRRSTACSFLNVTDDAQENPDRSPEARSMETTRIQLIDIRSPSQTPLPVAVSSTGPGEHKRNAVSSSPVLPPITDAHTAAHSSIGTARKINADAFDPFDLELWHHWLTVVCYTFADNLDGLPMWRDNIPKVSFTHPFVAHLIMALSALHLARVDKTQEADCIAKFTVLQSRAISGMTQSVSVSRDTGVLWAAVTLLALCHFAQGPASGQYLLYAENTELKWLGLLQHIKALSLHNHDDLESLIPDDLKQSHVDRRVNPEDVIPGIGKAFAELRSSIDALRAEDSSFDKYVHPMNVLETCFGEVFERSDSAPGERIGGREGVRVNSHQVFVWLYKLHQDYLVSLQDKRPMAIVILAHYLVLMAQLRDAWYLEGWVPHIMESVNRHLHPTYQRWLEWPQSRI